MFSILFSLLHLHVPQGLANGCDFTKDGTVASVQKTLQAMEGELEKKKKYDVQCNDPSCSFLVYFSQTRQADNEHPLENHVEPSSWSWCLH